MALPSASRHSTLRPGAATAAPVADGQALADGPAGEGQPVVGRAPAVAAGTKSPAVFALVHHHRAPRGGAPRRRRPATAASSAPGRPSRAGRRGTAPPARGPAPTASASASRAPTHVVAGCGQRVDLAPLGHEVARQPG